MIFRLIPTKVMLFLRSRENGKDSRKVGEGAAAGMTWMKNGWRDCFVQVGLELRCDRIKIHK